MGSRSLSPYSTDLYSSRMSELSIACRLPGSPLITNFESEFPSSFYAELYKHFKLPGGHVVMLGADDESRYESGMLCLCLMPVPKAQPIACRQAAFLALLHFPGGLQVGGGVTLDNAARYLDAGASHVIVTSYVFREGRLDEERLQALVRGIFHFMHFGYICLFHGGL